MLLEILRVEREVSQDQAESPQEQELEIDDENPDDNSAALDVPTVSSSDTDSFDDPPPFDISPEAVEARRNEKKVSRKINGRKIQLSQTVAQLYDDDIEAFLDTAKICGIQMVCSRSALWWEGTCELETLHETRRLEKEAAQLELETLRETH